MKRRISIEALDREEARLIEEGLARPDIRAFVISIGALERLPSNRARARVLQHVFDFFADPANLARPEPELAEAPPPGAPAADD